MCSGSDCCHVVKEDGMIEPPFLTTYDLMQISSATGLNIEAFSEKRKNSHTGNNILILKIHPDGHGCIFFDRNDMRCGIYKSRPIDCRLWPLDIRKFATNVKSDPADYHIVLYKFPECNLPEKELSLLIKYAEQAVKKIGEELLDFATYSPKTMETFGFERIKLLRFDSP